MALAGLLAGSGAAARDGRPEPPGGAAAPVAIHILSDRLTLRVAKAPQLYLSGEIGAEALRQVRQLLDAGRIPAGTDVYLDSAAGDLAAGLDLGRLFRNARLNTHVGAWREPSRHGAPARPAVCLDACAYAYLGGVYRWAPSGADRIGVHDALLPAPRDVAVAPVAPSPPVTLRTYLESMDVRPVYFAQVLAPAENGVVWWKADLMASWLVANNGRLLPVASYQPTPGAETLVLSQMERGGQNRLVLRCAPGSVTLTAHYAVGDKHADRLAAHAVSAYFEVDGQPWQSRRGERPRAEGDALVFERRIPFEALDAVMRTQSLGAWIEAAGSPVRYGFHIAPGLLRRQTGAFYADCRILQAQAAK